MAGMMEQPVAQAQFYPLSGDQVQAVKNEFRVLRYFTKWAGHNIHAGVRKQQ